MRLRPSDHAIEPVPPAVLPHVTKPGNVVAVSRDALPVTTIAPTALVRHYIVDAPCARRRCAQKCLGASA